MKTPPRCTHCGSAKFGLIRYRAGLRQFCKKKCRDAYRLGLLLELRRPTSWYEFLSRPR